MMINRSTIILLSLMAGCATEPVPIDKAESIAPEKQLAFQKVNPGTVPLMIIRDQGWAGAACDAKIFIDGKLAAYLSTSQKVTLHIPAGEIIIGMQPTCWSGLVEQSTLLVAGKPKYFRVSYDGNSQPQLQPTIAR